MAVTAIWEVWSPNARWMALETVLTLLALRDRTIPATINLESKDPEIELDVVTGEARALPEGDLAALNNSFGFGGANVALVVKSVG